MSEQELRDGLRLAVVDEPPMGFDVDELVSTAERLVRRRRALIAVGASTAAVAVAAVAVPVMLGIGSGPAEIPQATSPSASVSVTSPAPKPPPDRARLVARGAEMQTYLGTVLPTVVPNSKDIRVGVFGGEADGVIEPGQTYLDSFVSFTLDVRTAIDVQVRFDQDGGNRDCAGADCQRLLQADGSFVVVQRIDGGRSGDSPMLLKSATHFRNDGSSVRVTTYNYDPTGQGAPTYQPDVALDVQQLTRLATDPALHL